MDDQYVLDIRHKTVDWMSAGEIAERAARMLQDIGALPKNRQLPVSRLLERMKHEGAVMAIDPRWVFETLQKEIDEERQKTEERLAAERLAEEGGDR